MNGNSIKLTPIDAENFTMPYRRTEYENPGYILYLSSDIDIPPHSSVTLDLGIKIEVPDGENIDLYNVANVLPDGNVDLGDLAYTIECNKILALIITNPHDTVKCIKKDTPIAYLATILPICIDNSEQDNLEE